jgi:hypothetical protein
MREIRTSGSEGGGCEPNRISLPLSADKQIRISGDLGRDRLVIPWRVADEMLKLLWATRFDHRGHPLKGALAGLRQTPQIALRYRRISRVRVPKNCR